MPESVKFYALRYPMEMPPQPNSIYPNPDDPRPEGWHPPKYWYEKDRAGKMVAIDQPSGGYPYPASRVLDVKFWVNREGAELYKRALEEENFELVEVTITFEDVE